MHYFYTWLALLLVSITGSMLPGISFALVVRNSLRFSRSVGIFTAVGLGTGIAIYVIIVLFGFALVILQHPWLSRAIEWLGAGYLIYVGVHCLRAQKNITSDEEAITLVNSNMLSDAKAYLMGLFTNLTNPKVLIFFLALFSQFLHPGMPALVAAWYGATFVVVEVSWFSLLSIMLTHPLWLKKFRSISHWIERGSGVILLLLAVHLIWSKL